jgi:hypothetical protein
MVMGGKSRVWCFLHGQQTARGCVIECPVCEHINFLKRHKDTEFINVTDEEIREFEEDGWKTSRYNDPWDDDPWAMLDNGF